MPTSAPASPVSWSARHYRDRDAWLEGLRTPNATCPFCHQPVFYFAAQGGRGEYFNGLGPLWARHPCADGGRLKRVLQRLRADQEQAGPALAEPKGAKWLPFWVQSLSRVPGDLRMQKLSGCLEDGPLTLYVVDGRLDPEAPYYVWQDRKRWYLNTLIGSAHWLVDRVFLAQEPLDSTD